jgi:hypothetical protein
MNNSCDVSCISICNLCKYCQILKSLCWNLGDLTISRLRTGRAVPCGTCCIEGNSIQNSLYNPWYPFRRIQYLDGALWSEWATFSTSHLLVLGVLLLACPRNAVHRLPCQSDPSSSFFACRSSSAMAIVDGV